MSLDKLNNCIKIKGANNSRAREAIYKILMESKVCLNVSQISKQLSNIYPKKISQNTLYRHLNFFMECQLVVVIQDDYKRAYYHLRDTDLMIFSICPHCNSVGKIDSNELRSCDTLKDAEFITLHKICNKCK